LVTCHSTELNFFLLHQSISFYSRGVQLRSSQGCLPRADSLVPKPRHHVVLYSFVNGRLLFPHDLVKDTFFLPPISSRKTCDVCSNRGQWSGQVQTESPVALRNKPIQLWLGTRHPYPAPYHSNIMNPMLTIVVDPWQAYKTNIVQVTKIQSFPESFHYLSPPSSSG
jgi:hypothetical protein